MPTTTNWAIGAGLAIVALAIGGTAAWRHQHPGAAPLADMAGVLPKIPALDPTRPGVAAQPPKPAEASVEKQAPKADNPATIVVPHFDVARIEPAGDAIVAGSGAPNANVALVAGGKVLAETQSDANGQFVLLPPALTPGDQTLTLRQSLAGKPVVESSQKLVLSVPSGGKGQVVIALAEPGKPTRMLSAPLADSPAPSPRIAAAAPKSFTSSLPKRMAIQSTTVGSGNAFHANGVAAPGTPIHLYLNNSHLADVIAGPDGRWRVLIRRGLGGGHYAMRADAISPGDRIAERVEVPFDVPFAAAEAATSVSPPDSRGISSRGTDVAAADVPSVDAAPASGAKGADPHDGSNAFELKANPYMPAMSPSSDRASAVIDAIETHQVFGGDNLWNISRVRLGEGMRFSQIYAANAAQIRDPNLIYPGQVFVIPRK